MKNYRCSKLIVLLLAILIAAMAIPAMAEEKASSPTTPFAFLVATELNDGFMKTAPVIVDEKNNTVADFSAVDPNGTYKLKLNVANPADAGDDNAKKLPSDTSKVVVYYTVHNMKAIAGNQEDGDVSWKFVEIENEDPNDNEGRIVFSWPESEKTSFTAEITVTPYYPTDNADLSGSYVLGTLTKVMLCTGDFTEQNRHRVNASTFTEDADGTIYPNTDEDPVWVLTRVTGDYYTIRSRNTGEYLYMSCTNKNGKYAKSLYLVTSDQQSAQKIKVVPKGNNTYSFQYSGGAITNVGKNAVNGFAVYVDASAGNGDNEKFKLYSESQLAHNATIDVSGTWAITNANSMSIMSAEATQSNRLKAISYMKSGDAIISAEEYSLFTFEHVNRNWYTVSTDGGYLNLSSNGAVIAATPQNLLVRTNSKDNDYFILSDGEFDKSRFYALSWIGTSQGYGTAKASYSDANKIYLKRNIISSADATYLTFSLNGGTAADLPLAIEGAEGDTITLPGLNGTKNGQEFIGWCEASDTTSVVPGTNHTYRIIYTAGSKYTLKSGANTLYAIYNTTLKNVRFGIRVDGVIQDEPNGYPPDKYTGHFWINDDLKIGKWIVDIDATKPVNGYTVANNVTANLNRLPTAKEINDALEEEGAGFTFDPETQYIHWYVLKHTTTKGGEWHVDGVIRNKTMKAITYNMNVDGAEKSSIQNMPDGREINEDNTVTVGTNSKGEITEPKREGYDFVGWSTEADGTGDFYKSGEKIEADGNTNLYAQWVAEGEDYLRITAKSNWPEGKIGYPGAEITLTATLEGFENKTYTLQWQYSEGNDVWTDMPGANEINYTFILQPENAAYIWRAVARDIQNKE